MQKLIDRRIVTVVNALTLLLLLAPGIGAEETKVPGDTIVYRAEGKKRVHVVGCRRLTKDPEELAKMEKMTLAEAEAKGWPLCSRCPGSTTPGKGNPEPQVKPDPEGAAAGAVEGELPDDTVVYHAKGKKRVHVVGCRRLTTDPEELAKMEKMTLAEAKEKGLPLCSRCPGSTTPRK